MAGLGASGAGFAAGGAPGMAMGALSPVVGYLAKKTADRMTAGAMDRLGDLARVGGNASALQAPLNAVQRAARSAAAPLSAAITNAGILASLGRVEPDSRAAALSELLSKYSPPADGLGAWALPSPNDCGWLGPLETAHAPLREVLVTI
jgi:hypothetical protein